MSEDKKVLLRISNLKQYFPIGKKQLGKPQEYVKANDGITLNIYEGETFWTGRRVWMWEVYVWTYSASAL